MLRKEDFAVIKALKKRDVYVKDIAAELGVHPKYVPLARDPSGINLLEHSAAHATAHPLGRSLLEREYDLAVGAHDIRFRQHPSPRPTDVRAVLVQPGIGQPDLVRRLCRESWFIVNDAFNAASVPCRGLF